MPANTRILLILTMHHRHGIPTDERFNPAFERAVSWICHLIFLLDGVAVRSSQRAFNVDPGDPGALAKSADDLGCLGCVGCDDLIKCFNPLGYFGSEILLCCIVKLRHRVSQILTCLLENVMYPSTP